MSADELLKQLQLQAEANRAISQEAVRETLGAYSNADQQAATGVGYRALGNASVPQGTALAANYDPTTGEVVWVETFTSGESGSQLGEPVPCANGTDCLDTNFCYGWYECDPCEWCENNQCVPRDENRPCGASWECPCAPNDQQHYDCVGGACLLTCQTNDDCEAGQVCGLTTGYCGPGCESDAQCDPSAGNAAGDAQANTFCQGASPAEGLGGECVFPCDPVRYCETDADCFADEYCGDREYRVASDPGGAIYECVKGCRDDSSCEPGETCNPDSRSCYRACLSDADCPEGEGCNEDGSCSNVGQLCVSNSDCEAREYCSTDGRCAPGCSSDADCAEVCEKVQSCVDACPPEPGCSCEGDGCYDENWRDYCDRDPACVAGCPDDPTCLRNQGATCIDNRCERQCTDSSNCLDDEICSDGLCMVLSSTEGDPADDRLGCNCGDVCNQFGTCEPAICVVDEQCPACSICEDGVCVEGCSDSNPCPDGQCCNPDGRCSKACTVDADCANEPGNQLCLEGGCCGLICDPLVPCVSNSDCGAGQFCGGEGYCVEGCFADTDCPDGERCDKRFVRLPNGAAAPCEDYPGETCYSERGQCQQWCTSNSDCEPGETCVGGDCLAPPEPPCVNDNDCEAGEICRNNSCTGGCRYDSQCESGEVCRGNRCEQSCSNDEACKALVSSDASCVGGICVVINQGGPGEGGRQGCECFEYCDKGGYCVPYQCSSDLECEIEACGSCLSAGVCGPCFTDSDCPGVKICDRQETCDESGQNCQPDPEGGVCAYGCTPGGLGVCLSSSDCPDGFYCAGGECQRGCIENSDCQPGTVCRGDACVPTCTTDAACPSQHRCISGGCRFIGAPCNSDNPSALAAQAQIDRMEAQTASLQDQIDAIEAQEAISEADEQRIQSLQGQIDAAEQQLEVYRVELDTARNQDCPNGQQCNGDQCEPIPPECLADFECQAPAKCVSGSCVEPPSSESYEVFDPAVIGCQSCADMCDCGVCRPAPCQRDGDCPCGFCGRDGLCREECATDLECASGVCESGECQECRTNGDCRQYGSDAVCDGGECRTPCYTGLSTGNCSAGLNYGDTCSVCPDKCPQGAPCRETNEVCGVQEVYNPITRTTRVVVTPCKQCSKACTTSSDCEDGYVCNGFGICVKSDGRCTVDSDCAEDALASGADLVCRNNTCIELGATCFTQSDCDSGEVCDGGNCVPGTCGDNNPCQLGKVCADNQCRWQCGSNAEVFLCSATGSCPPGFYCASEGAYGSYCLRPGMRFSEITNPGCPVGEMCCGGACVPMSAGQQCCDAEQCPDGQECCEGRCKYSCNDGSVKDDDDDGDIDDGELEPQDNCQLQGKCCGEDGWCAPCGCDEKNPCPGDQCCDRDSGQCVNISQHPNTKYGAPYACDVGPVFCELLGPASDDGSRSTIDPEALGSAGYKGCEVYDAALQLSRCWEGGPKTAQQVKQLLASACWEPSTKQCRCDEIPSSDECATDADCGACGRCESRTWRNDACCGIYGEGEYETTLGDGSLLAGVDYVRRNICVQKDGEAEDCGCRSDSDCTECETCIGGGPDALGVCTAKCEELCPCGGELSQGGKCPSCEETYGLCARSATFVVTPGGYDPETGEEIPEESGCACVVDRSKECCKGHQQLSDLLRQRYRCEFRQQVYGDGTVEVLNTETCLDPNKDQCAQCEVDAHCPGSQKCKGYQCVSECGKANSDPAATNQTADRQDTGGIGGDPYSCWCCSEKGECRAKYETWIESKEKQKGPWVIAYAAEDGVRREWRSEEEEYASAVADLKAAFPGKEVTIYNAQGQNSEGDCRPCECGETGINCGVYAPCSGCYEWRPDGDPQSLEVTRAETLKLEAELADVEKGLTDCDDSLAEQQERATDAEGAYLAAQQFFAQYDRDLGGQLEDLYAQLKAEETLARRAWNELQGKRSQLTQIERDLELAAAADNQDALVILSADRSSTEEEIGQLEDSYSTAIGNRNDTRAEIDQLESQLRTRGPESQLAYDTLEQKRQDYYTQLSALEGLRQSCDDLRTRRGELLTDVQKQQNPRSVSYTQQRTCSCCIEGSCRPESECTYGTCYQCVLQYSGEYRAALYGKVLGQRISRDTPMPEGDNRTPMIKGRTEWKYRVEENTCVKYPCGNWYKEERFGRIRNVRYYEYCTGSVLGCVLSYNKTKVGDYLQGWKYEVMLDDAGVYFTNDFTNWVKMGAYEGSGVRKAECLYNNPLGFMGANDLGMFYELVATHPICNYAEVWLECPPEVPNCSAYYETLYEAGAPDLQIKRLEREIAQLEAYIAALYSALGQLDQLRQSKLTEKADLQEQLDELAQQLQAAQAAMAQAQQQLQDLEQQITDAEAARDALQETFDERLDTYVSLSEQLQAATEERQAAEQELEAAEYQRKVASDNLNSAASQANTLYLQANELRARVQELRTELAETEPNTVEAVQLEAQIAELEQELENVNADRSAAVSDMLGYEEEIAALDRLISVSSCESTTGGTGVSVGSGGEDCRSLERRVTDAKAEESTLLNFVGVAFGAYIRARDDLKAKALELSDLAATRTQVSADLAALEVQVQELTEQAGEVKYDPELCDQDGYSYRFVQTGGSINGQPIGQRRCCSDAYGSCDVDWYPAGGYTRDCAELCERIKAVDGILENIRVSREEVTALIATQTSEKAKKQAEINRLNDANQTPSVMTGPVPRPTGKVKTADELRAELEANVDVDKFLGEQDSWIPGATSQA